VIVPVRVPEAAEAERVAAEAFEAGALGLEEREDGEGITLLLYAARDRAGALLETLAASCGEVARVGEAEAVSDVDWSEAWKEGLEPVVVAAELVVRPPFRPPVPGHPVEVVIEPGQAFGTGGHASTRLALEWIAARARELAGASVLDVGCGSGVLALAALRLGARSAVAFDLDPLAAPAARENARCNGLQERLALFTGPLEALAGPPFDWVLANMLSREFLPLAGALAERTALGGAAVFSGLLEEERSRVTDALAAAGLRVEDARRHRDGNGDVWLSLLTRR
jgi:ribosomal protein L11 methyltransferase